MNDKIQELAKKSGFIFWKDEPWGPGPGNIDWSCDYGTEFNDFVKSLIHECAKIANDNFNSGFCPVGDYIKGAFEDK